MGKKIIISESQYKRVFLSEQNIIEKKSTKEIQKFLNNKGFTDYDGNKLKEDNGWGDKTASAFAKYFLGDDTPIKNSKDLWVALKLQGLDVGSSYKSTTKMVNAIVDAINYKESPTTGVKDFITDLIGGEDGVGISWDNMQKFWDRAKKYSINVNTLSTNSSYEEKIKTKDDGDKFRQWLHTKPSKLKKVNETLNDLGLDNLDKTGPHDNINFLVAWKLEGDSYYIMTKPPEKVLSKYDKFKIANPEYENVDLKTFESQKGDITTELKDRIRRSQMYETYLKAKNKRSTLSSKFGWSGPVEISSKNLNSILTGKVLASTAINPENILAEFKLLELSLINELKITKQTDYKNRNYLSEDLYIFNILKSVESLSSYTNFAMEDQNLSNWGKKFESDLIEYKRKCPLPHWPIDPLEFEDMKKGWIDYENFPDPNRNIPKDLINYNLNNLNLKESESDNQDWRGIPANYNEKSWEACSKNGIYTTYQSTLSSGEKEQLKKYREYVEGRKQYDNVLKDLKSKGIVPKTSQQVVASEIRFYNLYSKILEVIEVHNAMLAGQDTKKLEQLCDDVEYDREVRIVKKRDLSGGAAVMVDTPVEYSKYFSWSSVCDDKGGIFTYPVAEDGENPKSWDSNKGICCCVTGHDQKLYGKTVGEWCGRSVGDTRYWYELDRIGDAIVDCVTDWHCVADVISIVAYAFGPWGAVVSGIVDLISAVGYVFEQDSGWKLNAGLTALGVFGIGEGFMLAKRGVAFSSKLEELGAIAAKYTDASGVVKNSLKMEREIANWATKLSKEEKQMYDVFIEFSKKLEGKGGKEFLQKISKEMEGLSDLYRGTFTNILKKESPETIEKLIKEAGGDFKKMIRNYFKGGKQVLIQGSLFVTLYGFSDKMGKGLLNWCEFYGFDPLGIFDDECKPTDTKGKSEGETTQEIKDLENIDFAPILIKDPEFVDALEEKLKSLTPETEYSFDEVNFEGEMIGYRDALNNIENAGEEGKKLEESVSKLHKKLRETINGYGSGNSADPLNPEKINEKINIVLKVYEKIISTDFERVGLIDSSFQRLIDDALNDLEDKKGNKVTEEAKKVIQQTGNPDSGTEQISMFNDIMGTIEDIGGGEVDNSDNEKTDLKEEIKRIKSLFGNDRVYGNLIK